MQLPNHNLQRVFHQAFTALDIANPLPSFDDITPAVHAKAAMQAQDSVVAGVRRNGFLVGFVEADGLGDGPCGDFARPFDEPLVVDETMSLAPLVLRLNDQPRLFVASLGQVVAMVSRTDFQKPAARMWLFGMVTLLEMRFSRIIERFCPADDWKQYLSEGRLQKAQALLDERARCNQRVALADCLQFSDKATIIARKEQLRSRTRFSSRRQLESVAKQLEKLRNNLAHSQDIVAENWEMIVALSENMESVLNEPGGMNQPLSQPVDP